MPGIKQCELRPTNKPLNAADQVCLSLTESICCCPAGSSVLQAWPPAWAGMQTEVSARAAMARAPTQCAGPRRLQTSSNTQLLLQDQQATPQPAQAAHLRMPARMMQLLTAPMPAAVPLPAALTRQCPCAWPIRRMACAQPASIRPDGLQRIMAIVPTQSHSLDGLVLHSTAQLAANLAAAAAAGAAAVAVER